MKNYKLFPKITLWTLLALGIVFIAMFFLGGNNGVHEVAGDILDIPRFTDAYLIWTYILVGLGLVAALASVIVLLSHLFKKDKKRGFLVLAVLFIYVYVIPQICWLIASPAKVDIIGYEGTDNVGTMARLSEAMLYWVYFSVGATLIAWVWGQIHTLRTNNKK